MAAGSFALTGINYILNYIKIENLHLNIFQYFCISCIFDFK